MNAINFIDGLDGLVAGVALIANGVFFLYSLPARAADRRRRNYFNLASLIAAVLVGACVGLPAAQLAARRSSSWATPGRCCSAC